MRIHRSLPFVVAGLVLVGCSSDDGDVTVGSAVSVSSAVASSSAPTAAPATAPTASPPPTTAPPETTSQPTTTTPADPPDPPDLAVVPAGYGAAAITDSEPGVSVCPTGGGCDAEVILVERGRDAPGRDGVYGVAPELRADLAAPVAGWFGVGLPGITEAAVELALTRAEAPVSSVLLLADESDAGRDAVGWAEPLLRGLGVAVTASFPLAADDVGPVEADAVIVLLDGPGCEALAPRLTDAGSTVVAGPGCGGADLPDGALLVTEGAGSGRGPLTGGRAGELVPGSAEGALARLRAGERPVGLPAVVQTWVRSDGDWVGAGEVTVSLG